MTAAQPRGSRNLVDLLEKLFIASIFITIVLFYFFTGDKELKEGPAYLIVLFLETLLAIYYVVVTRNLFSLFLAGFIVLNVGYLLALNAAGPMLIITGKATYFVLGLFLGYKTVVESIKNKDWELFGTLTSIAFLFPLFHHFYFPSDRDYIMVYHFSLAFMLGTIIYNENLWDKYNASEKKILTYVLVCTVADVLFISFKLL